MTHQKIPAIPIYTKELSPEFFMCNFFIMLENQGMLSQAATYIV